MQTFSLMLWFTLMMSKSRRQKCIISLKKVGTICHGPEQFTSLVFNRAISLFSASISPTNNADRRDLCIIHLAHLRHYDCKNTQQQRIFPRGWIDEKWRQTHASEGIWDARPSNFKRSLTWFVFHVLLDFEWSAIGLGRLSTHNNNKSDAKLWHFRRKFRLGELRFWRRRR